MRIGIDFDNTIAGYDGVFGPVARELGLITDGIGGSKNQIHDALWNREDYEQAWQRLQGQVYGKFMGRAKMMDGVDRFLADCRDRRETVFVVSHKTEFGHQDSDCVNLRDAALAWMTDHGFFDAAGFAIPKKNVFFEATRREKIARIAALDCTYFIDDLEEIFLDEAFPVGVKGVLYGPRTELGTDAPFEAFDHWDGISEAILGA